MKIDKNNPIITYVGTKFPVYAVQGQRQATPIETFYVQTYYEIDAELNAKPIAGFTLKGDGARGRADFETYYTLPEITAQVAEEVRTHRYGRIKSEQCLAPLLSHLRSQYKNDRLTKAEEDAILKHHARQLDRLLQNKHKGNLVFYASRANSEIIIEHLIDNAFKAWSTDLNDETDVQLLRQHLTDTANYATLALQSLEEENPNQTKLDL